ncbi:MAG: phosphodiester glycosidase family protein [Chloroflexi bacterium AL-W]|nr:phosphodiester glycosidase family protein [Chloroflexi bacterium AL-N1]NOK71401.1 phosphodiester glycosidase family protein [Chloroflexi bacterium AL-N10]NOK78804.1 phosphodiester glycosidase family protein [Chloroflexi bacterium AL-N5]NOK86222.1 phosphodiester glycosidase family protein [Chloroflexi bacterium AL-W]NOK93126.1 phosphodiester glycosidase family protein [Chloroflexi bacterium AL-N15]
MLYRFHQVMSLCTYGISALLALILLNACTEPIGTVSPTPHTIPTLFPTLDIPSDIPETDPPSDLVVPDTGWIAGSNSVESRRIQVDLGADLLSGSITVVRFDPTIVRMRVAYDADNPRLLSEWFNETNPLIAVNGGFFTEEYRSTALVISDGAISGQSYENFGGMLAVASDGTVSIRSLSQQPYNPDESLVQAMQSFPMLIQPGGIPTDVDNIDRAQRTVVAQDRNGRIMFVVSPDRLFTLSGMAQWLSESDLEIDSALNLDGGSSTGIIVNADAAQEQIEALGRLPLILLVES